METPDVEGAINIEGGDKVGFKRCHTGIASGNERKQKSGYHAAYEKLKGRESTKKHLSHEYSPEDIERIVKEGTSIEKCRLSQHFFDISGLYKRIILHYATFLTYSWLLIPHAKGFKGKLSEKSN